MNAIFFLVLAVGSTIALLTSCNTQKAREISTGRIILIDENGKTRAEMVVTPDGPALKLYDASGKPRLVVGLVHDAPAVTLGNASGVGVAVLGAPATGPGLMLYDQHGSPRAQFDVGEDGPRVYLEDQEGFSATLGNYYFTADGAKNKKTIAASLVLAHRSLGTIWQAPPESVLKRLP
jgi:hypothetical protein